jgi:hypothetical protein
VSAWFAFWEGADEALFSEMRGSYPHLWRRFILMCQRKRENPQLV